MDAQADLCICFCSSAKTLLKCILQSPKPIHTCAKKVLLAVGRLSLANIDWDGLKQPEVQDYIQNSLFDVHAGKMYFASPTKWWADLDKTPHLTVSDTPLRQTFHFNDSEATGMYVLNTGYLDSNTCKTCQFIKSCFLIPRHTKKWRGIMLYVPNRLSICPSVHPSVCLVRQHFVSVL